MSYLEVIFRLTISEFYNHHLEIETLTMLTVIRVTLALQGFHST